MEMSMATLWARVVSSIESIEHHLARCHVRAAAKRALAVRMTTIMEKYPQTSCDGHILDGIVTILFAACLRYLHVSPRFCPVDIQ
eukprot:4726499-Amphidinium_carterae.1